MCSAVKINGFLEFNFTLVPCSWLQAMHGLCEG